MELFLNYGAGELRKKPKRYMCGSSGCAWEDPFTNSNGNGAVAWADYDNDGDLDLFCSRIYENDGMGSFTEKTGDTLFDGTGHDTLVFGDYDQDGYLDFISGNKLYRNKGDKTFELKQTFNTGSSTPQNAIWFDMNGDSLLDILLMVECMSGLSTTTSCNDMIYRNNGDGTFTAAGKFNSGSPMIMTVFDYDSDGDLDIFVGTYSDNDRLLRNDGGVFTEIAKNTHALTNGASSTYAVTAGDYDNDGDIDLYVGREGSDVLFRNNGDGTFTDSDTAVLFASTATTAAANFVDLDNDGDLDLFVGWTNSYGMFRNDGGGKFIKSTDTPINQLGSETIGDAHIVDIDNDVSHSGLKRKTPALLTPM